MWRAKKNIILKLDNLAEKLVSFSTIIWMFLFFLFVFRVRSIVGHWPYYAHPDPKNVGLDVHYFFILIGSYLLFLLMAAKLASSFFKSWTLFKAILYIVPIGIIALVISGEFGGVLIIGSSLIFLIISALLVGHMLINKKFDFYSSLTQITLILFWIHNIYDPFLFMKWFLD